MNKRSCQYPICFTWDGIETNYQINTKNKLLCAANNSNVSIVQLLAEAEFKCVYDKDRNHTAEVYVHCLILEKTYHLGVNLTDTVRDVKNRIKRLEKIPLALMHLFYNELLLKDHRKLLECGVKNKSCLLLGVKMHTAFCEKCTRVRAIYDTKPKTVTLSSIIGPPYVVELPLISTIEHLKEVIDQKYGVYPNNQLIICNGKRLEDDVTLEEYNITSDTELLLVPYQYDKCGFCSGCAKAHGIPTITLDLLGNKIEWTYHPEQTIRKLKEQSYQYLHHIHPNLQQVLLKNKELKDPETLDACGIRKGTELNIRLKFHVRRCDKCHGPLS